MAMNKGRDLLLKIAEGESFLTLGAARVTKFLLDNNAVEISSLNCKGYSEMEASGGLQSTQIYLEGIFKDEAGEELLRLAAFNRQAKNYLMAFPNGDMLEGLFVISEYKREGSYNGLEIFSLKLLSTGANIYTSGE